MGNANDRHRRKTKGLCLNCSNHSHGKSLCSECIRKQKDYRRSTRQDRREKGLCVTCGQSNDRTLSTCSICSAKDRHIKKIRREQGLCSSCGIPCGIKCLCENCMLKDRERINKQRDEWRKKELCTHCGRERMEGLKRCKICRDRKIKREQKRREQGLCIKCSAQSTCGSLCRCCYLKTVSNRWFKTFKFWKEIGELFDINNGICPYSGLKILLGDTAEIDHVIPRSQSGQNDLSNIQWVHKTINAMKGSLLEDEFISMCLLIAKKHHDRNPL